MANTINNGNRQNTGGSIPANVVATENNTDNLKTYNISRYSFPEDVGNSPDLPYAVVFYINTTKVEIEKNKEKQRSGKIMNADATLGNNSVTAAVAVSAGVNIAFEVAKSALSLMVLRGKGASISSKKASAQAQDIRGTRNTELGKTVGTTAALIGANAVLGTRETFRISDAIVLGVQAPPKVKYHMDYDTPDFGSLLGGAENVMDNISSSVGSSMAAAVLNMTGIPTKMGNAPVFDAIQKNSGKSLNPFKTTLFKGVSLREFTFEYKFMPKSKKEAENVMAIIQKFKTHMHPEFADASKLFFLQPSDFDIVYYYKGQPAKNWHKIGTCVLVSCELDAGSEHRLMTFEDGMSIEINMHLTFKETEIMTRDKIREGY